MTSEFNGVAELTEVMRRLRDPEGGCPWDLKQNFESLLPYTIEETYEVVDAIQSGDMAAIKDELGDLLFQVVFMRSWLKSKATLCLMTSPRIPLIS